MFYLFSDFIGAITLDLLKIGPTGEIDWPDQVWFDIALQDICLVQSVQLDCSGLSDCALAKETPDKKKIKFTSKGFRMTAKRPKNKKVSKVSFFCHNSSK